jgi:hypothetical protein
VVLLIFTLNILNRNVSILNGIELCSGRKIMRKTKFSDEKIAAILRQAEAGTSAIEVCRQNGISEQTLPFEWECFLGPIKHDKSNNVRLNDLVALPLFTPF